MRVYVDNAATMPVKEQVLNKMLPYFCEQYGNPSSIYSEGQAAAQAVNTAREQIAGILNCKPNEILFTGGGTEADNWAILQFARANANKGNHIITSQIEHHAVLHTCQYLEKHGFEITYLPVDEFGLVSIDEFEKAIKDNTILVTIMMANNEIGTVQPIKELAEIAGRKGVVFHTDAVQTVGHMRVDVQELGLSMLSLSAHKFGGPKGVGALYLKSGVCLHNLLHGGAQERGKRAGTENVPGIVGMAEALTISVGEMESNSTKVIGMRDRLISEIPKLIPYCRLNGHPTQRLDSNVNFSFEFIEGESLLLHLDMKGISASSGSACTSGSLDPSHVLLAIGLSHGVAHGSLRLSLSENNTDEQIDYILECLPPIVQRLRDMSPLYEQVEKQ